MRKKLIACAAALTAAVTLLGGCELPIRDSRALQTGDSVQTESSSPAVTSETADTQDNAAAASYSVAFSCPDENNAYYAAIIAELTSKAEAHNSTLTVVSAGSDNMRQNSQIRRLLKEDLDGLFLIPVDASGVTSSLEDVRSKLIPVIGMEKETSDLSYLESYVSVDHYKAGQLVASELTARFPEGGTIAILEQANSEEVTERISGFTAAIKDHGFTIAQSVEGGGSRANGKTAAEGLISAGEYVAIIAGNDAMALGAMDALSAAEVTDTVVYGFGGSPEYRAELASGNVLAAGTCAKSPSSIADVASQLMFGYLDGSRLKSRYLIDPFMITTANVADFSTTEW